MKLNFLPIFKKGLFLLAFVIIYKMFMVHNEMILRSQYNFSEDQLSVLVAWPGGMYCDPVKKKYIENVRQFLKKLPDSKIHFITETKQIQKSEEDFKALQKEFENRINFYDLDLNEQKIINGLIIEPFVIKEIEFTRLSDNGKKLYNDIKNPNSELRAINPAPLSDLIRFISLFGIEFKNDDNTVFIYMDVGDTLKINLLPKRIANLKTIKKEIINGDYQTCFPNNDFSLFRPMKKYSTPASFLEIDIILSKQGSNVLFTLINQISREMYLKSELLFQEQILKNINDYGLYYDNKKNYEIEKNLEYLVFLQSSIFSKNNIEKIETLINNLNSIENQKQFFLSNLQRLIINTVIFSTGPGMAKYSLNYPVQSEYKGSMIIQSGIIQNEGGWGGVLKYKLNKGISINLGILIHFFHNYFSKNIDPKIKIDGKIYTVDQNKNINEIYEIKKTLEILFYNFKNLKNQDSELEPEFVSNMQNFKKEIENRDYNISYQEVKDLYSNIIDNLNLSKTNYIVN